MYNHVAIGTLHEEQHDFTGALQYSMEHHHEELTSAEHLRALLP